MRKKRFFALAMAVILSSATFATAVPMTTYAEEIDNEEEGILLESETEEYNYLDTNMRLSWGVVSAGQTVDYQNAIITNNGSDAHALAISVSSSDMWDIILPSTLVINPGESISVPVRPNLKSSKWGTGDYSDVITISGFDSDYCDITDSVSVNLYITLEKKAAPWVSNVSVSPASIALSQGQSYTFNANVTCGDGADSSVKWSIQGNTSGSTYINNGTIYVADNETSSNISVVAVSNQNPNYLGSATVMVNKNKCNVTTQSSPSNGGATAGGGSFDAGSWVSVAANPANGFKFDGWYENNNKVSSDAYYSFATNGNRSLVAKFVQNSVRITTKKNIDTAGTITESQTIMYGGNYTITAKANSGFKFVGWYEGNNLVSNSESYSMNGITNSRELTAVFSQTVFNVLVNRTPAEGGTVKGAGNYSVGSNVDLSVQVSKGYKFVGWISNNQTISTSTSITIKNLDKDYALTAVFMPETVQQNTYTISASAGEGGSISPGGSIPALEGKSLVFSISANKNYKILDVKVDGNSQGAISSYTFYDVRCNHSIVATFESTQKASGASNSSSSNKTSSQASNTSKVTGASSPKEGATTAKPTQDEAYISDDVSEVTALTGSLQDLNMTPDEARSYIESGNDRTLMESALVRGDLQVTVFNGFSVPANETTTTSYYDISSIPNMEDVLDGLLTEEDKISLFEGSLVRTNLNISGLANEQVNEIDKNVFDSNIGSRDISLDSYFDVRFITEINGMPALVTTLNKPLRVVMNVPEQMKAKGNGNYCVCRVHDGEFTVLEDLDNNPDTVTFETDKMSTFALGYYNSGNTEEITGDTITNNEISNDTSSPSTKVQQDNTNVIVAVAIAVIAVCMLSIVGIVVSSDRKHRRRRR